MQVCNNACVPHTVSLRECCCVAQDPEPTWVEEIMRKLQHFTIEADGVQRLLTEDEKREFAIILGDEEEFYNHFFGPGSADADAMVDELKELSDIAGAVDDNAPTGVCITVERARSDLKWLLLPNRGRVADGRTAVQRTPRQGCAGRRRNAYLLAPR